MRIIQAQRGGFVRVAGRSSTRNALADRSSRTDPSGIVHSQVTNMLYGRTATVGVFTGS